MCQYIVPCWPLSERKVSGLPLCKLRCLILKMWHRTTSQAKQKICANLDHHWSKNAHFFKCTRSGFVYQELRDFVKMTLTRVPSLWLWLESSHHFSQRDSSRVRVTRNRDSSWVESLTRVTLSLPLIPNRYLQSCQALLICFCAHLTRRYIGCGQPAVPVRNGTRSSQ